jgi:hypothetical protein
MGPDHWSLPSTHPTSEIVTRIYCFLSGSQMVDTLRPAAEERMHGDTTLVVFPSAGGEIRTVAKELTQYFPYDWSPDNDRIVFAGLSHGVWNIYWISVSTGKVEQLTHFTSQFGSVRYPAWSPKGDQILFEHNDLTSNIYIADLSSSNK